MATPIWTMGLMVVTSLVGAIALYLLKKAAPELKLSLRGVLNKNLILGFLVAGLSTVLTLIAFKFGELSVLYPFVGLQYIWTTVMGVKLFGETMGWKKYVGISLVVFGIAVIGISS